jgi:hypothetical protein
MRFYASSVLVVLTLVLLMGCKQKKKVSLAGEEPVEASDFIAFFPSRNLPFVFADSLLQKKENDSLLISNKVFTQFVPDSVLQKIFGKNAKLKTYPLGKVQVSRAETYLFAKVVSPSKKAAFILVFDASDNYLASLLVLRSDGNRSVQTITLLDNKYTITKTQTRKNADGSSSEGKEIYAFSAESKDFMLIMTDALDDKLTELQNPIDTFGRKHKFAADYGSGKLNLVSIRDGRKNDRLSFFIHFEKNNGECKGELKGEAMLRSANLAEYRLAGDPCVLQFRFSSTSVTLREIEGCGARRDLRCSFDGTFVRKKVAKPKTSKSRTTRK